ncbi:MAG: hypothetical protein ACOZQL_40620 [Myxococcota bacterium]
MSEVKGSFTFMNRVFETERAAEAKRIDARSRADQKQLELLAQNPLMLRMKELEVLREIGLKGGNSSTSAWRSSRRSDDGGVRSPTCPQPQPAPR